MRAYFQELNELLRQINKSVVDYDLYRLDPRSENEYRSSVAQKLGHLEAENMRQELESRIEDSFKKLHETRSVGRRPVESISTDSAQDIIDASRNAVEQAGLLETGTGHLQQLKKHIIRHQQRVYMQNVMHLRTLVNASNGMKGIRQGTGPQTAEKQECFAELIDILDQDNPDDSMDYLLKSGRLCFDFNDHERFAIVLEALEKKVFSWSLTPSINLKDRWDANGSDQDLYDYVRLLHQLEEMEFRFSSVQKSWEGLLVSVYMTDDPNETLKTSQETLDSIRANIGSKDMIRLIRDENLNISRQMRDISTKGPRHLQLVTSYIRNMARDIQRKVFGKSLHPSKPEQAERYIFVTEPRKMVQYDKEAMAALGFPKTDLESRADTVYGIMSAYTQYRIPPTEYKGDPAGSQHTEKMYIANRIWVLDLYKDEQSIPKALLETYKYAKKDDPRLKELLQKAELPSGAGHVRKASHIIFSEDFSYSRHIAARDSTGKEAVHITPIGEEEPTHQEINRAVSMNTGNTLMSSEDFAKIRDRLFSR